MIKSLKSNICVWATAMIFSFLQVSCSSEEPAIRSEKDMIGVWFDGKNRYMVLDERNRSFNLYLEYQDGETIGRWEQDGYFYEPGYNIMIYIDQRSEPMVYKIVSLTQEQLVWCWVENLLDDYHDGMSIGQIIGNVLKNAHEGYELNPNLYQYFSRVPEEEFYQILDDLDIFIPWDY